MKVLRLVPMICIMGTVFFLSHQPGDSLILPPIWSIDKVAHMAAYGLLAWSIIFSFTPSYKKRAPLAVSIITVIICVLYGITDEYHQSFIPLRYPSYLDVVADGLGGILFSYGWFYTSQRKKCEPEG